MISFLARLGAFWLGCVLACSNAWAIAFTMPIACEYGTNCFIQNYVDGDAGAAASDYRCGTLTYDGHKGTDFRLTNFHALKLGVSVLAAADGTVLRLRNNAPDTGLNAGREAVGNKECGNGLAIAHAEGYQTQYCHMQKGSIIRHEGERVQAGDILGKVGYSGITEFPHVHFQVMRNGQLVDPFNAASTLSASTCSVSGLHTNLWEEELPYIDTAILSAGFSNAPPARDSLEAPLVPAQQLPTTSPALILWVEVMGIRAGDVIAMRITAPDGSTIINTNTPMRDTKAVFFQYTGKKFHTPIAPGTYSGDVSIKRNGVILPFAQQKIRINIISAP